MKSVQFRGQNCSKPCNAKSKLTSTNKKSNVKPENIQNNEDKCRPGSCPTEWVPKRDWHQYLSGEPAPLSPIPSSTTCLEPPPLTLEPIPLPAVHFCSAERETSLADRAPSLIDLCDHDKRKIALLIEELARCKQEKNEDEESILKLKSKVSKLKTALKTSEAEHQTERKALSSLKAQHLKEQAALKDQLQELNHLVAEMQSQRVAYEAQARRIATQAEKMTQAIHSLHKENLKLKGEVASGKEKLGAAQLVVERMTKDLQDVQETIKPKTEDKGCQSTDDLLSERIYVKTYDRQKPDIQDQEILSELFFNKSVQNKLSSKETIIFLPADTKLPFD